MRSILIAVMLLVTVIVLYVATVGGEDGLRGAMRRNAEQAQGSIEAINP